MSSALTAGMPQITASTARRSVARRASSSGEAPSARLDVEAQATTRAARLNRRIGASSASFESSGFSLFVFLNGVNDGVSNGKNEEKPAIIQAYWRQCRP